MTSVTVTINDDNIAENNEVFLGILEYVFEDERNQADQARVTIVDNESKFIFKST